MLNNPSDPSKEAQAPLRWWSQWFETEEEMLEFYSGYFPTQEETLTNLTDILRDGKTVEE